MMEMSADDATDERATPAASAASTDVSNVAALRDQLSRCLADALHKAGSEPDPLKALRQILLTSVSCAGALRGRLFRLDLVKSLYECVEETDSGARPEAISVEVLNRRLPPATIREKVILTRKPMCVDSQSLGSEPGWLHISPIVRGRECLGLVELEFSPRLHPSGEITVFAVSIAATISMLFEKKRSLDLLMSIQQPINFHQGFGDFLEEMILLISDASGMPYIVLREHVIDGETETLRCLAQWGLTGFENEQLDFVDIPPPFQEVLRTQTTRIEPDIEAAHLQNVVEWLRSLNQGHKSFVVVPVRVGDSVFGTLSFACSCKYRYSDLEVAGFESIANAIGVSITNYRNFHSRQADIHEMIRTSTTITAVEVAQAARHEARSHIENAKTQLLLMENYLSKGTRETLAKLPNSISDLAEDVQSIELTLDRIRDITKPPQRERKPRLLNELWADAFAVVQGRLTNEVIEYGIEGKDVEASVFSDFLLHAFLNLILNSIEAFKDYGKKRNRQIKVVVEAPSDAANTIRMKYTDNAGGIDSSKLEGPSAGPYTLDDIYKAGVSSKKKGSGYGLYLVRNILKEHGGGIRLVSHRGGVQFELTLPK